MKCSNAAAATAAIMPFNFSKCLYTHRQPQCAMRPPLTQKWTKHQSRDGENWNALLSSSFWPVLLCFILVTSCDFERDFKRPAVVYLYDFNCFKYFLKALFPVASVYVKSSGDFFYAASSTFRRGGRFWRVYIWKGSCGPFSPTHLRFPRGSKTCQKGLNYVRSKRGSEKMYNSSQCYKAFQKKRET